MKSDYILKNGDFSCIDTEFKKLLKSDLKTRLFLRKNSKSTNKKNLLKISNLIVKKKQP